MTTRIIEEITAALHWSRAARRYVTRAHGLGDKRVRLRFDACCFLPCA